MEQIISGISDKLNEEVTKKQFLKECGFLIVGILVFPNLINYVISKSRFRLDGNKLYLDDELLIERREE
jgi:hypothetical protein